MLAGLPYVVWPFGSLFILATRKKDDPFLHYHAVQSLLFGGLMSLTVLMLTIGLFVIFRILPGSSTVVPAVLSMGILFGAVLLSGAILFTAILLGWRATEGEMLRIPFLGDYAEEKMLDSTGMTRRQFEAMLEASLLPQPVDNSDIPFPDLKAASVPPESERAIDRLEAARQARAAHSRIESERNARQRPVASVSDDRAERLPPPPENQVPIVGSRRWEQDLPVQSPQPSAPVVRELDLIGHYKDKRAETGTETREKNDVLRNWLSSVDKDA